MNVVIDPCHRTDPHTAHSWLRGHVHYESLCPGIWYRTPTPGIIRRADNEDHIIRGEN